MTKVHFSGYGLRHRSCRAIWELLLCLLLSAAASAAPRDTSSWTRDDAAHLLRRAGFGGTPQQIDRLHELGKNAAVDYLLTGQLPSGAKAPFDSVELAAFKFDPPEVQATIAQAGVPLRDKPGKPGPDLSQAAPTTSDAKAKFQKIADTKNLTPAQKKNQQARLEIEAYREWWLDRMVRSDRPLQEKMTLFWHGLFCSGMREIKDPHAMTEQNKTFHEQALGNYKALAHAMLYDTAMCKYLNANENVKGKPNENLGRELMELFTMGEGRGYTEKDIAEVARALTGLAPSGGGKNPNNLKGGNGPVIVRTNLHDDGEKTIFGQSSNFGPDDVINLIFAKPEPAEYLARRLWQFFAYPDPSSEDLAPVIQAIKNSNYEVKPALRAIFSSPGFYSEKAKFALIKGPTELAVETLRNLEITPTEQMMARLGNALKQMDQELFQPPNVRGWVGGEHWITSATLFTRYNVATAMVNGQFARGGGKGDFKGEVKDFEGATSPARLFPELKENATPVQIVDAAVDRFLQRPLEPQKKQALLATLGDAPLNLGQPDSDRRVREVLDLIVSTPEYQVH